MISPFLALAGTTMRVAGMVVLLAIVQAGVLRDDHISTARPQRVVAHPGDGRDALRGGKPDARLHPRHARARSKMKAHDVGNRVLLREYIDRLDVIGC